MTHHTDYGTVQIDVPLVRELVANQFPQWAELEIKAVENDGHDNRTFHLGDDKSVRMPSGKWYAAHVGIEHVWLPKLEPHLPLPVPVPIGEGKPGCGYPWHWSVCKWIHGANANIERIDDLSQFANDLAMFLNKLQSLDTTGAPLPGQHNFFRGGQLSVYDAETRECIKELHEVIETRAATSIWESALRSKWDQTPVWVHGDIAIGNLLVQEGRLCAVIDFGQLAAGDPACDVVIAWTLFSGPSRETFRKQLDLDSATWARGRGWCLWKALLDLRRYRSCDAPESAGAGRIIHDIIADRAK